MPRDLNRLAFEILQEATEEELPAPRSGALPEKDALAVELGRRGGLRGGKASAEKLTPEERSERARKAAQARWAQKKK